MDIIQTCKLEQFSITDREEKISKHFEQIINENQIIPFECLEFLIERGFYKTAVSVYENHFILNQIDISQNLENLRNKDRSLDNVRELQYIFKNSQSQTKRVQTVEPVKIWAQSKNNTLINIKFAMRIDAPACLNTKIEVIRIEENQIVLSAFGIVSHQPIRYETRINLYQPIVPNLSTYKIEAVGTLYFNLTKVEPKIWIRLTEEDVKTQIWWDLHDQLRKDMDEFIKLLEEESERKEKLADKKYQNAQKKREKEQKKLDRLFQLEKQRQLDYERNQCNIIINKCENGWYQRQ